MSIRFDGLGINLGYVPKSLQFLGIEVSMLGILLTVSMLLGILFVVLEAKRRDQDQNVMLGAILMAVPGAVIGGRLFYVVFSWNLYKSDPMTILSLKDGGMAYYGAVLGGILFVMIYSGLRRVPFGEVADNLTFAVLIVQIFTRWGDFFNRESFGMYTEAFTAMQLPLASVRSGEVTSMMRENLLTIDGASWIQVHPTFLYESVWCAILFLIFVIIKRKKRFSGEIYMRYMAAYGFERFFIEWLRTDQLWIPTTTLPINMILAASFFVVFNLALVVSGAMEKKRQEASSRRRKELEEARALEQEQEEKTAEPVDIEALLREDEMIREQERLEAEKEKAAREALEEAERVIDERERKASGEQASEPEKTVDPQAEEPGELQKRTEEEPKEKKKLSFEEEFQSILDELEKME